MLLEKIRLNALRRPRPSVILPEVRSLWPSYLNSKKCFWSFVAGLLDIRFDFYSYRHNVRNGYLSFDSFLSKKPHPLLKENQEAQEGYLVAIEKVQETKFWYEELSHSFGDHSYFFSQMNSIPITFLEKLVCTA